MSAGHHPDPHTHRIVSMEMENMRLREALNQTTDALQSLLDLVKTVRDLQGREHVSLGIQVNAALHVARAALAAPIPAATTTEGQ